MVGPTAAGLTVNVAKLLTTLPTKLLTTTEYPPAWDNWTAAKDNVGPFAPLTPPTFKTGNPFFRHE